MAVDRFNPRLSSLSPTLQRIVADAQQLEALLPPAKMALVVEMLHAVLHAWQQATAPAPPPHPVSRRHHRVS